MTFGLNRIKEKKNKNKKQLVAVEASVSISNFSANDMKSMITASLKENGPRLITTCLQKPQHGVINLLWGAETEAGKTQS